MTLDLMRVAAASFVVVYHFFFFSWNDRAANGIAAVIGSPVSFPSLAPFTEWGWVGVYIFFVISGFVITMSAQNRTASAFAVGRILRLYPALFFFSALALVVTLIRIPMPPFQAFERWLRAVVLFPKGPWIDGAVWTLTVEAMFYFVIWLAVATRKTGRLFAFARYVTVILGLFWLGVFLQETFGLGTFGAFLLHVAGAYPSKFFLLATGSFFALGMLLYESHRDRWNLVRAGFALVSTMSCMMAVWVFVDAQPVDPGHFLRSHWTPVLVWLGFVVLCAVAIETERLWKPGRRYRSVARALGLMTYPLYLINQVSGGFVIHVLLVLGFSGVAATMGAIVTIFVASFAFAIWLEPALRKILGKWIQVMGSYARFAVRPIAGR